MENVIFVVFKKMPANAASIERNDELVKHLCSLWRIWRNKYWFFDRLNTDFTLQEAAECSPAVREEVEFLLSIASMK